jgi:hypothetical protein
MPSVIDEMNALEAALDVEFIQPEELDASDAEVMPEPKPRGRPAKVAKPKPEVIPETKPEPKPEPKKFQLKKPAPKVEEDLESKYNALLAEVIELRKIKAKVDAEREAKRARAKNRDAAKKAGTYVPKRGGKKAAPEDAIRQIVRDEVNKMVSESKPLAIEDGDAEEGLCCVEGCENVATETGACEECEAEAAE